MERAEWQKTHWRGEGIGAELMRGQANNLRHSRCGGFKLQNMYAPFICNGWSWGLGIIQFTYFFISSSFFQHTPPCYIIFMIYFWGWISL